jgi:hypothetical protein
VKSPIKVISEKAEESFVSMPSEDVISDEEMKNIINQKLKNKADIDHEFDSE